MEIVTVISVIVIPVITGRRPINQLSISLETGNGAGKGGGT